eukprot:3316056-Prymnesium_polylepis.1
MKPVPHSPRRRRALSRVAGRISPGHCALRSHLSPLRVASHMHMLHGAAIRHDATNANSLPQQQAAPPRSEPRVRAAPPAAAANASGVHERKIGTCGSEAEHCAPDADILATSVQLLSNGVANGRRTVVLTRTFAGASPKHYTFDPAKDASLKFVTASGTSPTFGYHKMHAPAV